MRPTLASVAALIYAAGTLSPTVWAAAPPTQGHALGPVALGRARAVLFERVRRLPLGAGATIDNWLAAAPDSARALQLWVRERPPCGAVRLYSDGVCEADTCVDPAELRDRLIELLTQAPDGATKPAVTASDVQAAAARWPALWATGTASVVPEAAPGQPLGWEDVAHAGVLAARRDAESDAYAALLAGFRNLEVDDGRRLAGFLDSSPLVREAVGQAVRQESAARVDCAPDQLAVATVRFPARQLPRILMRICEDHYHGDEFSVADFRALAMRLDRDEFTATGLAAPPPESRLRDPYTLVEHNPPPWAGQTLTATGRYEPATGESLTSAGLAEAARLDGIDRLRLRVETLVIQDHITVGDFLAYQQELKPDVVRWLSGAHPVARARPLPGGGIELDIEVPLRRLWEILRRKMKLEDIDPPEPGATSRPATTKETP